MKKIGLIASIVALSFMAVGCADLYNQTSAAITADNKTKTAAVDAAVAKAKSITIQTYADFDGVPVANLAVPTDEKFTLDEDKGTVSYSILEKDWLKAANKFGQITLKLDLLNGGTSNYTAGQIINLVVAPAPGAKDPTVVPYTLTVTSKDGKVKKNYVISVAVLKVPTSLSIIGNATGSWDNDKFTMVKDSATSFTAITNLVVGEFKLRNATNTDKWKEAFGASGSAAATVIENGNPAVQAYEIGADNVKITKEAAYLIRIDFTQGKLVVEEITTFGLIGAATSKGWGGQTNMTFDKATDVFTITASAMTADEWKFRANDNWAIAFAESKDAANVTAKSLQFGPNLSNLKVAAAGDKTVTFNGRTLVYDLK